jgi:uncharacterized membrane protein YtjA (UPF0391 family)
LIGASNHAEQHQQDHHAERHAKQPQNDWHPVRSYRLSLPGQRPQLAACSRCEGTNCRSWAFFLQQLRADAVFAASWSAVMSLLKWALIMLVVSLGAALFGFTGLSAASAEVARLLFFIFVVIFLVLLVLGLMARRSL